MKLIVNQPFPALLSRADYALVPVVDREGRVKILKVNPGKEHGDWLRCEWGRNPGGRATRLISVDLTSAREAEGCVFLRHAYEAEQWAAGWSAFEAYMKTQFTEQRYDEAGNEHTVRRSKAKLVKPFPDKLLPKRVLERRAAAAGRPKAAEWTPPAGLVHPADMQPAQAAKPSKVA